MSVTLAERAYARKLWRELATSILEAAGNPAIDAGHLRGPALNSSRWSLPMGDDRGAAHIFGALGPMARAYAYQPTIAARVALAPQLTAWAATVLNILHQSEPGAQPPPATPFRADIDG